MKYIEELRDKHKGETIWVMGAGPSIDRYPLPWLKNQVCIGVNWVFSAFVDIGDNIPKLQTKEFYSVHAHKEPVDWIARHKPDFLEKCFILLPPFHRRAMCWWEDYNESPYYMRWGLKGPGGVRANAQDFANAIKCIKEGGKECQYVCTGTTLHWAIQAAVVLGAKEIYVTGGEGEGGHMQKHGSLYTMRTAAPVRPIFHTGTRHLANALRPYGVKVVYYYYGKGEQAP